RFAHEAKPPSALPAVPGLIYFRISRDSQPEEWKNVQKSLTLAARLNETRIEGNIQGEKVFNVRADGKAAKLQFTLYVLKSEIRNLKSEISNPKSEIRTTRPEDQHQVQLD